MACCYVIYKYVFFEWRSIRPVEINQYDIIMATHGITMGNDITRDATMGNDVAMDNRLVKYPYTNTTHVFSLD